MEDSGKIKEILDKYKIESPEMLEDVIKLAFLASSIFECVKEFEEFCDLLGEENTELKS